MSENDENGGQRKHGIDLGGFLKKHANLPCRVLSPAATGFDGPQHPQSQFHIPRSQGIIGGGE